jgi:hypothetical protein
MIYLLECFNRKDIVMKIAPEVEANYVTLTIEELDTTVELEIILTSKDIFELVGILHHLQKQMSK